MKVLKQWFLRQLSKRAKPYLESYGLLKTVKIFHHSALVWEPAAGKILVLTPHMDDEVIGCGGTLYKHIRNGAKVTIVYLTDGRYGSSSLEKLSGEERRKKERELVETRKREARLAMETLGVKEGIFLDAEENNLNTVIVRRELLRILNAMKPDLVYLPFFLEEHPDHRATSQLLIEVTEGSNLQFDCCAYEVWTPLFPNCYVDISDVSEIKKTALQHYASQLADKDYIHTCLGLNAYRSMALLSNRGYAEAFFRSSLLEYRELFKYLAKSYLVF
jgi:LmbE family N-acetylglucosaminyl deacetylase